MMSWQEKIEKKDDWQSWQ